MRYTAAFVLWEPLYYELWTLCRTLAGDANGKVSTRQSAAHTVWEQVGPLAVETQRDHVPDGAGRKQALWVNVLGPSEMQN